MPKRKLIARAVLERVHELVKLGVPLNTVIRRESLDISRPHLLKLLKTYEEGYLGIVFPPWLDDAPAVQEEPDDWVFTGRWPVSGKWERR